MSVSATIPGHTPAEAAPAAASGSTSGSTTTGNQTGTQQTGTGATSGSPDFRSSIPEAYREKPYLRDVKAADDVFKMLDSAQSLIGKQGKAVPAADAPPEEWDKFFNSVGRPETPDKYEFERAAGVEVNPETDKAVKALLHKTGLSANQAKSLVKEYEALTDGQNAVAQAAYDAEFDTFAKDIFKGDVDKELRQSQELLAKLVPESAKKYLPELGNKAAIVLAAVMKEVRAKYVGEDATRLSGSGSGAAGGNDEASLRAEGKAIMANPAYSDPFHKDHAVLQAKAKEIYSKIK